MPKPIDTFVLKAAIQWAYKMIGIKENEWKIVEKLEDLIYEGREHFALYSHDAIKIWYAAEPSTVYHESFHRVSLGYLGSKEHARLIRAARLRYKMPKEEFTDKQVEEKLADEFQNFMRQNYATIGPKYTAIERFFIKLKQFIYRLFIGENRLNDYDIELLFTHIGRGLYSKSELHKDRVELKPGEYQKTIVGTNVVENLNSRLEYKDTIGTLVNMLLQHSNVTNIEEPGTLNFVKLAHDIRDRIIPIAERASKNNERSVVEREKYRKAAELYKEILGEPYKLDMEEFEHGYTGYDNFDYIWIPQINNYLDNLGVVKANVYDDVADVSNPIDDSEFNDAAGNSKLTSSSGGAAYGKASYEFRRSDKIRSRVKYLVKSLNEYEYVDGRFVPITNEWGGRRYVDFGSTWHQIMNLVYDCETVEQMIERLREHGTKTRNGSFLQLVNKLTGPNSTAQLRTQFFYATKTARRNFISAEVSQGRGDNPLGTFVAIDEVAKRSARFDLINKWTDAIFTDPRIYSKQAIQAETDSGIILLPGFYIEGSGSFPDLYDEVKNRLIEPMQRFHNLMVSNPDESISSFVSESDIDTLVEDIVYVLNLYHITVDIPTIEYYLDGLPHKKGEDIDYIEDRLYQITIALGGDQLGRYFSGYKTAAENFETISRKDWNLYKFPATNRLAEAYLTVHPELIEDSILGPDNNMYYGFSETCHTTDTETKIKTDVDWLNQLAQAAGYRHSRLLKHLLPDLNAEDIDAEMRRAEEARDRMKLATFSHMRNTSKVYRDKGRGFFNISPSEDFLFNYAAFIRRDRSNTNTSLLAMPMASREAAFYVEGMPVFDRVVDMVGTVNRNGQQVLDIAFSEEVLGYFYGVYLDEVDTINNGWALIRSYLEAETDEERNLISKELVVNKHYVLDKDGNMDFTKANVLRFQHLAGLQKEGPINFNKLKKPFSRTYNEVFVEPMKDGKYREMIQPYLVDLVVDTIDYAYELGLVVPDADAGDGPHSVRTTEMYNSVLPDFHMYEMGSMIEDNSRGDLHVVASLAEYSINKLMGLVESEKMLGMNPELFAFSKNENSTFADLYKRMFGPGSSGNRYVSQTETDSSTTYTVSIAQTQLYESREFFDTNVERHSIKIADRLVDEYNSRKKYLETRLSKANVKGDESRAEERKLLREELDMLKKALKGKENFERKNFIERAIGIAKENLKGFLKVDPTDGGSWISVKMFKKLLDREGVLSPELSLLIDEVNEGRVEFTDIVSFMPQKTMYIGLSVENGSVVLTYDKMSMGVLFKSLAVGTPMEEVYNRMNAIGKYEGLEEVDQVLMDTAVKSGGRVGFELFVDGNEMTDVNDLTNIHTWKRDWSNLRKQQEINVSEDNTGQSVGSAVRKVAGTNIAADGKYKLPDGTEVKGSTMRRMIHASSEAISNMGATMLRAEYGVQGEKFDVKTFANRVRISAIKAGKPDDFVNGLRYDEKAKSMRVALDATTDRTFIHSSINKEIKKYAVDLNMPGAHLVQLSNWGLTNKKTSALLNMQLPDPDGDGLLRMECRVSTKIFRHLLPNYDDMTHEERVAELKKIGPTILGYRTPTQGQNSVMALKVVDFLPHEAADTIFLPLEFTQLTGFDYEIDKFFVAFKEYEIHDNKVRKVEFITGVDKASVERRYNAKVLELWDIYKSSRGIIPDNVFDKLAKVRVAKDFKITERVINDFIGTPKDKAALQVLYKMYELGLKQRPRHIDTSEDGRTAHEAIKKAIEEILNPVSTTDVSELEFKTKADALVKAELLPEISEFARWSIEDQNTKKANTNRLLDIFDTILLSSLHELSTTRPLDSNKIPLEKFASAVQLAENGGKAAKVTPFMSLTERYQAKVKANNVASARLVGPFALANAFHFITQSANTHMHSNFKYFAKQRGYRVNLGRVLGEDGIPITDWFSAMISATVDLLKNDYIVHLNVNDATIGAVELMLKLGFGKQTFHYMVQPILKEYSNRYYAALGKLAYSVDDDGSPVFQKKKADEILDDLMYEYGVKAGIVTKEKGLDMDLLEDFITSMQYYESEENALADVNTNKEGQDLTAFYIRQISIANQMKWILSDGDALTELTLLARVDTGKIGSTPAQRSHYEIKLRRFLSKRVRVDSNYVHKFTNVDRVLYSENRDYSKKTEEDTFLPTLFQNSFALSKEILKHVSIQSTDGFHDMFIALMQQLPVYKRKYVSLRSIYNIEEAMVAYFIGHYYGTLGVTTENIEEWFVGVNDEKEYQKVDEKGNVIPAYEFMETSVFSDLRTIQLEMFDKYPNLRYNYFLKLFADDIRLYSPLPRFLRIYERNITDALEMDDYRVSFDELLLHEDPFIRQFAAKLKMYAFYSTGNRHRLINPGRYMSTLSAIDVPIKINGELKHIKFTEFFNNLLKELNNEVLDNGTKVNPLVTYMNDIVREVMMNNWWDGDFVRRVNLDPEIMDDIIVDNTIMGIAIKKDFADKWLYYGSSKTGLPLYERFITIGGHVPYESWNKDTNYNLADHGYDYVTGALNATGLYEFVGVDAYTKLPIYIPINKSSYSRRGQEISELGVNKTDGLSAVPGNNLYNNIPSIERLRAIDTQLKETMPEGTTSHLVVYTERDFAVEKWSTKNYDDSTPSTSRKGYKH